MGQWSRRLSKAWALSSHVVHLPLPLVPMGWVLGHVLFCPTQSSDSSPSALEGTLGAGEGRVESSVCLLLIELQ